MANMAASLPSPRVTTEVDKSGRNSCFEVSTVATVWVLGLHLPNSCSCMVPTFAKSLLVTAHACELKD